MDESTVQWKEERWNEIRNEIMPFLLKCGNTAQQVHFLPISGLNGDNLLERVDPQTCPWYQGPSLVELMDTSQL